MNVLLVIHIIAGFIALCSAAVAVISAKGQRVHIYSGRAFFWGMVVIFFTAIPLALAKNNIFLFLIAIFSFYLAFAGMRFARNRGGIASWVDWLAIALIAVAGLAMWGLAMFYWFIGNTQYITLALFGSLALRLGYQDYQSYMTQSATGKQRIARHLTNMLGGTIAVITAVLVINVKIQPLWIWWIMPTLVILPAIIWWNKKVLK